MKQEFRISPLAVRRMRWSLSLVPVLTGLIGAWLAFNDSDSDLIIDAVVTAVAVVIASVVAVRAQRRYARRAVEHSVFVLDDGVLFQEGRIELKVPFEAVQELAIKRRKSTVTSIVLKYNGHREVLSGYEELGLLARLLQESVQRERVSTFSWFHV